MWILTTAGFFSIVEKPWDRQNGTADREGQGQGRPFGLEALALARTGANQARRQRRLPLPRTGA